MVFFVGHSGEISQMRCAKVFVADLIFDYRKGKIGEHNTRTKGVRRKSIRTCHYDLRKSEKWNVDEANEHIKACNTAGKLVLLPIPQRISTLQRTTVVLLLQ